MQDVSEQSYEASLITILSTHILPEISLPGHYQVINKALLVKFNYAVMNIFIVLVLSTFFVLSNIYSRKKHK